MDALAPEESAQAGCQDDSNGAECQEGCQPDDKDVRRPHMSGPYDHHRQNLPDSINQNIQHQSTSKWSIRVYTIPYIFKINSKLIS